MDCAGALCTIGALEETCGGDTDLCNAAIERLAAFLKVDFIPSWNDARFRTQGDVVAALRSCAARPAVDEASE
jgi:hypothetical protein